VFADQPCDTRLRTTQDEHAAPFDVRIPFIHHARRWPHSASMTAVVDPLRRQHYCLRQDKQES
jgi:hypothetical protein